MTEREFWLVLEYRLEHEFAGMADRRLQYLWCDGFIPVQYQLSEDPPKIVGRAWICDDRKQEKWGFTLFLPTAVASVEDVDWRTLIPAQTGRVGWPSIVNGSESRSSRPRRYRI
jgi:hypothetical protein